MKYEERTYRSLINKNNLVSYAVQIQESDLFISSDICLEKEARQSLQKHRNFLESYIQKHPDFKTSLLPMEGDPLAPPIVRDMISVSDQCGVGPMASVAGAVSEFVARDLLELTSNLIIENGGDIFLRAKKPITAGIFAGESPLSYKLKLLIKPEDMPLGICTSSASVGPSISFGKADAVCVISKSATLADAAASAVGNRVKTKKDIRPALDFGMSISGILGLVIILGKEMGAAGQVEFV